MKKLTQKAIALILACILLIQPTQAFAAEELPTEAVYDMELGGTQTFTIQDEDGEIATVTIEELAGNSRVENGNYRVGYDNTTWQAAFTISVSNNKIYNAYDPYYYCLLGEINYPGLTRPSTTQAILAFIYKYNQLSFVTGVDVNIIDNEIIITKHKL